MTVLFQVNDLVKSFDNNQSKAALGPVSFEVKAGEHLGIIGESGSGKTTLSRIMLGLMKPSSGSVLWEGNPVPNSNNEAGRNYRKAVQLVLQDPFSSLNPRMRIFEIIAEPLRALGETKNIKNKVAELLESVELPAELANRYPKELSGGQRQRVAIARALGPNPKVIIADEPVSALDVSVREQIMTLLKFRAELGGLTLIVISHDLGVVQQLCTNTIVMNQGEIMELGATEKIMKTPQHPYTQELLASIPRLPARAAKP